jgi:transposase-like protein
MTNGRVEVITSAARRRRWPRAEKERIVAASLELGAIARKRHGRRDPYKPVAPLAT